ncbi:hypothetical protein KO317_00515 [Candidatus Micrarchaeota archaeon]|jgi:hypothetical protein|nr:hypothetical protein [Candidatus Micrarchaeota archaeon]
MKYLDWQNLSKLSVFTLLLCFSLAHAEFLDTPSAELASWQTMVFIAVSVSFSIVIFGYIIASILQNQHYTSVFKDELIQVIFTGIGIAVLLFIIGVFEISLMPILNEKLGGEELTLHASAQTALDKKLNRAEERFEGIILYTNKLAEQGSKYASCSFWSVGFYIGGCSGLNVALGPITTGLSTLAIGITDLYSLNLLNQIGIILYTFLLPLGIFFRTFHLTRQFGGFLIAVALAFGIVFPVSVLFLETISQDFHNNVLGITRDPEHITYIIDDSDVERCNEFNPSFSEHIRPNLGLGDGTTHGTRKGILNETTLDILAAEIIVDIILFTLILIIMLLTFITATVSFFGGTVDLMYLTRLSV